jgi:hypothetical protein
MMPLPYKPETWNEQHFFGPFYASKKSKSDNSEWSKLGRERFEFGMTHSKQLGMG